MTLMVLLFLVVIILFRGFSLNVLPIAGGEQWVLWDGNISRGLWVIPIRRMSLTFSPQTFLGEVSGDHRQVAKLLCFERFHRNIVIWDTKRDSY